MDSLDPRYPPYTFLGDAYYQRPSWWLFMPVVRVPWSEGHDVATQSVFCELYLPAVMQGDEREEHATFVNPPWGSLGEILHPDPGPRRTAAHLAWAADP